MLIKVSFKISMTYATLTETLMMANNSLVRIYCGLNTLLNCIFQNNTGRRLMIMIKFVDNKKRMNGLNHVLL